MALVLEILLGVAILASFFVAYMSARNWQVYQVILVAFIFLGTVAFFYLAARTLATHNAWRTAFIRLNSERETLEKQTADIQEGGPPDDKGIPNPKGIRQLKKDLQKLVMHRGGALFDVAVEGVKDGTVQLALPSGDHGLTANAVVFVFDQLPFEEGGRYRGEFKVVSVGEDAKKVQIAPNLALTEAQAQALPTLKGPLALYTTMPVDDPAMFAAMDDAARQKLLPPGSQAEYAKADRKPRDYHQFFREHFVQRRILGDTISELESNIQRMTSAQAETEKESQYRTAEKGKLAADFAKFEHERQAIAQYAQSLQVFLRQLVETLNATYAENQRLAAELTSWQLAAAREIDRRSEAAAAAGP
jgi:hypothetical protein